MLNIVLENRGKKKKEKKKKKKKIRKGRRRENENKRGKEGGLNFVYKSSVRTVISGKGTSFNTLATDFLLAGSLRTRRFIANSRWYFRGSWFSGFSKRLAE